MAQGSGITILPQYVQRKKVLSWSELEERLKETIILNVPLELELIRHAQSEGNAAKLITGSQNVGLTANGEQQARNLSHYLSSSYDIAFCSTLKRASETLRLALGSNEAHINEFILDDRLNERSLGILEGQAFRYIPEYANGNLYWSPPGGESYMSVVQRILCFLLDLAELSYTQEIQKVLISSHVGVIRIFVGIIKNYTDAADVLRLSFSNAQVVKLSWSQLQMPYFIKK